MTLDKIVVEKILNSFNYKNSKKTAKAITFNKDNNFIYLLPNKMTTIIVDPKIVESNKYLKESNKGLYHSTALIEFPKKINNGKREIHYGYKFILEDNDMLRSLLNEL